MNIEDNSFFVKMVDELIEFSEHDKELSDGIKWIDSLAQSHNISFYDMMYKIIYQHDMNQRVNDFINKHSENPRNIYKTEKHFGKNGEKNKGV